MRTQGRGSPINADSRLGRPKPRNRSSFRGFKPSSPSASAVGKSNIRENTKPEVILSRALKRIHLPFATHDGTLPGCPDFVFRTEKVAVFCDGDFWHGRRWSARRRKLARGHNSSYWIAKIQGNITRDGKTRRRLRRLGWKVLRVWESDVLTDPLGVAERVAAVVEGTER